MNKQNISLGRILGIPIRLDYSWFLVVAFLTWSLATVSFPSEFGDWPTALYWMVGAATTLMMFEACYYTSLRTRREFGASES